MKLTQKDKDILREKLKEELENIPEGERVHINKEALEELLFDKVIGLCKGEEIIVKLPVWSGAFLRKIDLSEVSFDNVLWDWSPLVNLRFEDQGAIKKYDRFVWYFSDNDVDYSYTNAQIDFKNSINNLDESVILIKDCDFSGLDLTNSFPSEKKISMERCTLQNAKLLKNVDNSEFLDRYEFLDCDLTGVDLSNFTVDIREFICDDDMFFGSTVENTGLNLTMLNNQFRYCRESDREVDEDWGIADVENYISNQKQRFGYYISNDMLAGCYLNGKLIHSSEERKAKGQRRLKEYNEMKDRLTAEVLSSIKTKKLGTK